MMTAEASTLVHAPLAVVRDAVLDPDAYARGDTKVARVSVIERTAEGMLARIHGHLGPFHSSILARYTVHDRRVDLEMLEGRLRGFDAGFWLDEEGDQVRLTHREHYDFGYGPLSPILDRVLRGWATRSVVAEVEALRRAAEERAATLNTAAGAATED